MPRDYDERIPVEAMFGGQLPPGADIQPGGPPPGAPLPSQADVGGPPLPPGVDPEAFEELLRLLMEDPSFKEMLIDKLAQREGGGPPPGVGAAPPPPMPEAGPQPGPDGGHTPFLDRLRETRGGRR
jgi:hypothetical protein